MLPNKINKTQAATQTKPCSMIYNPPEAEKPMSIWKKINRSAINGQQTWPHRNLFAVHDYSFSWCMTGFVKKRLTGNKSTAIFQFINLFVKSLTVIKK
jgi:hypothetical protein